MGACVVGIARAHANRLVESEIRDATLSIRECAAYNTPARPYSSQRRYSDALESCRTNGAIPFQSSCELALAQRTNRPRYVILYGVGNLLVTLAI